MAFRFRKSFKIAPGIRINISKKGISSVSLGRPGATVNINRKGTRTTLGLPGTGLSHSSYNAHQRNTPPALPNQLQQSNTKTYKGYFLGDWIIGLAILLLVLWVIIAAI